MSIAIILPYFGKLPNYFNLFLYSCSKNKKVTFIVITDQTIKKTYDNIIIINKTLSDLEAEAQKKICKKCKIKSPYKLCDYKPMYGILFKELLKGYDYWGFCDCDLIFGDLSEIAKIANTGKYEKILDEGHLQLYKNNEKVNNLYKNKAFPAMSYKSVIRKSSACFFDELSFNYICKKKAIKTYSNKYLYADILPQYSDFNTPRDNIKNQVFKYSCGKLKRVNDDREFIYIHLQKRKMSVSCARTDNYYIKPNSFSDNAIIEAARKQDDYNKKRIARVFKNPVAIIIKMHSILIKQLLK